MHRPLFHITSCLLCTAVLLAGGASRADEEGPLRLGYDRVVELARTRSPDVVIATRRVDETRGLLTGARALVHDNPIVEVRAGPRLDTGDMILPAVDVALDIPLEIYGQRGLRIDAAELAVDRDRTLVDDAVRRQLAEALAAYYGALRADAVVALAGQRVTFAEELVRIAERRLAAGDVGDLDVRVARLELARARRDSRTASAGREAAHAALRIALGLPSDRAITLDGALADVPGRYSEALVRTAPEDRPDVRAADTAVRAARADLALEERLAWPSPALRLAYERDELANVFLIGIAMPLPVFNWNQGPVAETRARVARLDAEHDFTSRRVSVEVDAARRRYALAVEGLAAFEADAIPLLDDTLRLGQRSYEEGHLSLSELLLIRRDALDTRREHLDALLDLGVAGPELQAALGILR